MKTAKMLLPMHPMKPSGPPPLVKSAPSAVDDGHGNYSLTAKGWRGAFRVHGGIGILTVKARGKGDLAVPLHVLCKANVRDALAWLERVAGDMEAGKAPRRGVFRRLGLLPTEIAVASQR